MLSIASLRRLRMPDGVSIMGIFPTTRADSGSSDRKPRSLFTVPRTSALATEMPAGIRQQKGNARASKRRRFGLIGLCGT